MKEQFKEISKHLIENDKFNKIVSIGITGSYASKLKNGPDYQQKKLSDYNFYVYIDGEEKDSYYYNKLLRESLEKVLIDTDYTLDLHPFSFYPLDCSVDKMVQLTTRCILMNRKDLYASYIWHGWKKNYIELYTKQDIFEAIPLLKKDESWFRTIYHAINYYKNMILNIPLFTSCEAGRKVELIRYTKELIKDGVQILMESDLYESEEHYTILHGGKEEIMKFYSSISELMTLNNCIERILSFHDDDEKSIEETEIVSTFFKLFKILELTLKKQNQSIGLEHSFLWF
ncbi:hypothetical protein [Enterococcus termitis]|uniref:DUF4037 domain-containing protein n=1 Tax=Enterococcus termitis TaxID=332950 RepID=A0A1E5GVM5_9ENTE|nr:hypothetical protein [Enterococcus termitis]OEG16738.1 hypothetical protein BCR25_03825 [Enterococcus termitis]OJG99437.1 hypothetical protein RV18_GL001505 [Enterococcus termitis]